MTRERRLAVQMWREIAQGIRDKTIRYSGDMVQYKFSFCDRHELCWDRGCYFCQYCRDCRRCPLFRHSEEIECGYIGNPYGKLRWVTKELYSSDPKRYCYTDEHARCADEIADVLQGAKNGEH